MRVLNVWLLLVPYLFTGVWQNSHSECLLYNLMETQTQSSCHNMYIGWHYVNSFGVSLYLEVRESCTL